MIVRGKVVYGKQLARTMGFPTANILYCSDMSGIYSGLLDSRKAILYIHDNVLEAHVLDWSGDLYDKEVEVHIGQKLLAAH
jgi:riboflavin kinase/FMN adenylyltransferase